MEPEEQSEAKVREVALMVWLTFDQLAWVVDRAKKWGPGFDPDDVVYAFLNAGIESVSATETAQAEAAAMPDTIPTDWKDTP